MKTRAILAVAAAAGLAGVANAQSVTTDSTITISLSATDFGGNGNGIVEPGESALLTMNVDFTNQNTVATFNPSIGSFGSGTVRGFGSAFLDLHGTGGAEGSWNVDPNGTTPRGVDGTWDLAGAEGTPENGGADLTNIQMGQFPPTAGAINTTNPVNAIWTGEWTPNDFSARTVSFSLAGNAAAGAFISSVMLKLNNTLAAGVYVDAAHLNLGTVNVQVAPAPGSLALLGLGGLVAGRRRRR
jgi:MYXO-CTERM domain-containing protein